MEVLVRLKPGSSKGPLIQIAADRSLEIYVQERAIEGRANDAALQLLADYYKVPKSRIRLISGPKSRFKRFKVNL